jgi:selenocysteine lyase/cysteine desulfurase
MFRALGQALRPNLNSDCEIIVSNLCHEAGAAAWIKLAKDVGITIKWWAPPPGDNPVLSLETLKLLLSPKTRIVTCNHVSNVIGNIHPIRQVADLVHTVPGAILIVDGVAWAPHRPVDVKALDIDFYCFSWYKVFGPHIAQLYGRRSAQKRVLTHSSHYFLSEMPGLDWRLRLGSNTFELEEAIVPIARYLTKLGWDNIVAQEVVLQHAFLEYLNSRPQLFRVFGEKSSDPSKRVSVITFTVIGHSSSDIVKKVCQKGRFRIVAGSCWAPRPTHDVLGLDEEGLIRVSFVHYNTISEVKEFTREFDAILGYA